MKHALLVHGMGRTPASMWRLARALRTPALEPATFGYLSAVESVEQIVQRLVARMTLLANDEYIVIGHSLGGLLLRAAVPELAPDVRRPSRIIMLGTPNHSPRLARRFERAFWYRALNGDAGALLAHEERIAAIPASPLVPCTIIAGTGGFTGRWSPFGSDDNDGIVAVDETRLDADTEVIQLPVRHPFMMNDRRVVELVRALCSSDTPGVQP